MISRRRFLERMGLGAAACPLVLGVGDSLIGQALGQVTRRKMAFIFVHGEAAPYGSEWGFTPVGIAHDSTPQDRTNVQLPSLLAPLEPLRSKLLILDDLELKAQNRNNIHGWKRGLLAATGISETPTHQTIDQYLATTMGKAAPVRSLLFGGGGRGSWSPMNSSTFVEGPGVDARHVGDPRLLLDRISGNKGTDSSTTPIAYQSKLLDVIRQDVRKLERGLAGEEKAPLAAYLAAMEQFQKRQDGLAGMLKNPSCSFASSASSGDNTARLTSMFRTATLALRCGVTNVVGATLGNTTNHDDMGGFDTGPWGPYRGHPTRPPGSPPPYGAWLHKFSQFSLGLVAEMVTALGPLAADLVVAIVPAGGVSNNDGLWHHGTRRGAAYIYDGTGLMKTGARFFRRKRDMADLYTTLAHVLGAPIDKFNGVGDGVIKELLS